MPFRASKFIDFNSDTVITSPMTLAATPKPWSLDKKIEIYECMIEVWYLGPAVAMLRQIESSQPPSVWSHSAYALVSMTFSYFEMIGKSLSASGKAGEDFNMGFCDVYPAFTPLNGIYADKIVQPTGPAPPNTDIQPVVRFRDLIRNGVYHLGYTKAGVVLHNDQPHIADFEERAVPDPANPGQTKTKFRVNPHTYVRTVLDHFPGFIARLGVSANTSLRSNFEAFFDQFVSP